MRTKTKIILAVSFVVLCAAAINLVPDTIRSEREETPVKQEIPQEVRDPLEQSREELANASKRLNDEEKKLLEREREATSTAAARIAEIRAKADADIKSIESERDLVVNEVENQIAKINELRGSF